MIHACYVHWNGGRVDRDETQYSSSLLRYNHKETAGSHTSK